MLLLLAENNYVLRITSEVLPKDKNEIVSQWLHKSFRVQSFSPWVLRVLIPPRSFTLPSHSRFGPLPPWTVTADRLSILSESRVHTGAMFSWRERGIDCWMIATWTVFISQLAPFVRLCPISLFSVSVFALSWRPPALYSERRGGSFTVIGHYLHRLNSLWALRTLFPSACLSFSGQDASLVSQWLSDLKSRTLNENPHIQRWEICLHQEACLVDVVQFAPADDRAIMQAKIIFLHWRTFKSMYFQEIDFIRSAFVGVSFHVACW